MRLAAAVVLLWGALHYGADATVLPRGLDRPLTVLVGDGGIGAALVVLVLLLVGAFAGGFISGRRDATQGLLVVGFALALWVYPAGTIDNWLIIRNPTAGPPTGAAYWPLLAEYFYWTVAVVAVLALGVWRRPAGAADRKATWRAELGLDPSPVALRDGITALVVTVAVAVVLMLILSGPRVGHTFRGQVYFSVAVALLVAVIVARRVTGVRGAAWYLASPLIVGLIGVILAAVKPGLGAGYEKINVIPAWGLVRPLPVEMVAVGSVAILLTLRTAQRLSSEEDRGR